jgi:hypothetical protein
LIAPVCVEVPVRLRLDSAADGRLDDVEEALRAALGRALRNAQDHVPGPDPDAPVQLVEPEVRWSGDGVGKLPAGARERVEARVRRAVDAGVHARGLPRVRRRTAQPSRQPPPAARKRLPIDFTRVAERLRAWSAEERGRAALNISDRITEGDWEAFLLALWGIRPGDEIPTGALLMWLHVLWRRNPARMREYVQAVASMAQSRQISRTEDDIRIDAPLLKAPAEYAAGLVRLARAIPALGLAVEWEQGAAGLDRLLARLRALADSYLELNAYLEANPEIVPSDVRNRIERRPHRIAVAAGVLATHAWRPEVVALVADLHRDVTEHERWVAEVLAALRDVDALLALYREAFGEEGAQTQEEVQVLEEGRRTILALVARHFLPRADLVDGLRTELADAFGSWRLRAVDRRVERLRSNLAVLQGLDRDLYEIYPWRIPAGAFGQPLSERPWESIRVPFVHRLRLTRAALSEAATQLDQLTGPGRRDLPALLALEERMALTGMRQNVLRIWMYSLQLSLPVNDLGSGSERTEWNGRLQAVRVELAKQYDAPDFDTIEEKLRAALRELDDIREELETAGKWAFGKEVVISIVALIVAKRFGGGRLTGGELVARVTIAEAAIFTVATTVGKAAFTDRPVDLGRVPGQFFDNVLFFAGFEVLNKLVTAGALQVLRGRPGAQLAAILGTNTAVAAGLPLAIGHLERRSARGEEGVWNEQTAMVVGSGLVLTAIVGALSGRQMLRQLELLSARKLAADLDRLAMETNTAILRFGEALREPGPAGAVFETARSRVVRLLTRLERELELIAGLDELALHKFGMSSYDIRAQAGKVGGLRHILEGIRFVGPPRGLPSPAQVGGPGLVRRSPTTYEYPRSVRPNRLARQLEDAGYKVEVEAGVLRLRPGPNLPVAFRLLPEGLAPLPARRSLAQLEAEALLLAAVGPGVTQARGLLAGPDGEAALLAAQLEPDLTRAAIGAEGTT